MARTALIADERVRAHFGGPEHPEQPARYTAVLDRLESSNLLDRLEHLPSRTATDDELALVHTRPYIELVRREVAEGRKLLSTGDTNINGESDESARIACGGVLAAVDAVCGGEVVSAFCDVRPPGHHAGADRGMGFCLYNNVAVASRYAQKTYGLKRVAIFDWDVHHGNGTQDIFYADGSVLFCSTHESPLYPSTGAIGETGDGAGAGKTLNRPFRAGAGRAEILGAFDDVFLPAAEEFRPELIMISAGFDSRAGDLLGHFQLTDADFSDLTDRLTDLAARHCEGRLVSVLEGGYALAGLASAAEAHVRALLGSEFE